MLVIVVPPVSASGQRSGGQGDMLTASSPLASPGNAVVLQILDREALAERAGARPERRPAGHRSWSRALGPGREYRMVLLATAAHGLSVSNTVTIPPR